jgi:enterochelin esterase-like enzyme
MYSYDGITATVVLPTGYDAKRRYPVVYRQNGFGGTYAGGFRFGLLRSMMARDGLHGVIVVTDSSGPTGITQFADSANNGPWGHAFVTEFIPAIEHRFNIGGSAKHRLLWGHSSGGWASLWLQITYPGTFGGTWSSSPDPVDFHDFTGPDLLSTPPDNASTKTWSPTGKRITTRFTSWRSSPRCAERNGIRGLSLGVSRHGACALVALT